jgi:hypothetical protein
MPVLRSLDQLMRELAFMRQGEHAERSPKEPMPQVRRSLINDKGGYRQIQREPDTQYFR